MQQIQLCCGLSSLSRLRRSEFWISNLATFEEFWGPSSLPRHIHISGSPLGGISISPPWVLPEIHLRMMKFSRKPIQNVDRKAPKILLTYLFYHTFRGEQLTRQSCKWDYEFNDQHFQVLPQVLRKFSSTPCTSWLIS